MYIKKGPTVKRVRFTNPIITWQFDFDSSICMNWFILDVCFSFSTVCRVATNAVWFCPSFFFFFFLQLNNTFFRSLLRAGYTVVCSKRLWIFHILQTH